MVITLVFYIKKHCVIPVVLIGVYVMGVPLVLDRGNGIRGATVTPAKRPQRHLQPHAMVTGHFVVDASLALQVLDIVFVWR